ncbi:TPA: hypothetical protein N0F65_011152 [Lagenidium giganteum]|uniref:HIT-type domain-containing protein n=1 Tax=Lagenidium giganteum TaxID=4803 RepID=A0AAV2Z861_9STRA|nr:TPA: hypothetical protein N0F65_011152 [Lagenidium giganteum]
MGKAYDGKKRWNETIAETTSHGGSGRKKKRYSGRTMKLSKAMRHVDDETRAIVRNARLDALEADNYGEDGGADNDQDGDDLYVDDDDADKRAKGSKKPAKGAAVAKTKARKWKVKSLAQLVFEEFGAGDEHTPNYVSVAAAPSVLPARQFCCVCGFFAPYACTRCGSRYCRVRCGDQHKESGCLKFGL